MNALVTPAKINLLLNVFARRPDGYHELDTVFYPLTAPADRIELVFPQDRPEGIVIHCPDPGVPADPQKNLCGRAVTSFFQALERPVPAVDVFLEKHIPCAGGMGGGSSDAAAVLRLLNARFPLPREALAKIALRLGADVPFFLAPMPSRARGVGEKLVPLSGLPDSLPLVFAASDFPVSAKWAYDHWTPEAALPEDTVDQLLDALKNRDLPRAARFMQNSLEAPLFRKFPVLSWLREAFLENGALCARITGSGPTMFALFPDNSSADAAARSMTAAFPSIRIFSGV